MGPVETFLRTHDLWGGEWFPPEVAELLKSCSLSLGYDTPDQCWRGGQLRELFSEAIEAAEALGL